MVISGFQICAFGQDHAEIKNRTAMLGPWDATVN
jgi:hypothetical protein